MIFQDPPTPKKAEPRVGAETQAILNALKERPGEWALIKQDVNPNSTTWWKKRPGIEAKSSTIGKPKNRVDVYVRWIGFES